jgi:dihydroxyacetone kinase
VIYRKNESRVALLSGGGSGHEPSHAGFVGHGLLDCAVAGNVFASPNVAQIRRGLDLVTKDKGALMVVMNYTGDALHFGLAAEQFRSKGLGEARVLMVGDDVAVGREQGSIVGRRYVVMFSRFSASLMSGVWPVLSWSTSSLRLYLSRERTWTKSKLLLNTLQLD